MIPLYSRDHNHHIVQDLRENLILNPWIPLPGKCSLCTLLSSQNEKCNCSTELKTQIESQKCLNSLSFQVSTFQNLIQESKQQLRLLSEEIDSGFSSFTVVRRKIIQLINWLKDSWLPQIEETFAKKKSEFERIHRKLLNAYEDILISRNKEYYQLLHEKIIPLLNSKLQELQFFQFTFISQNINRSSKFQKLLGIKSDQSLNEETLLNAFNRLFSKDISVYSQKSQVLPKDALKFKESIFEKGNFSEKLKIPLETGGGKNFLLIEDKNLLAFCSMGGMFDMNCPEIILYDLKTLTKVDSLLIKGDFDHFDFCMRYYQRTSQIVFTIVGYSTQTVWILDLLENSK